MAETPVNAPMGQKGADPATRARRWKRAFLGLAAVNLLALGLVGGMIVKGPPMPDRAVRDLGFGPFAGALEEADRRALRKAFFAEAPGLRDMRKAMREDLQGVLAALRADPFDPGALDRALQAQQARLEGQMALGQRLLRDRLVAMDVPARRAFADRLEKSVSRKGRDGEGRDREGRGHDERGGEKRGGEERRDERPRG